MIKKIKKLCSILKLLQDKSQIKLLQTKNQKYIIQPSAMFGNLISEIIWVNKYFNKKTYIGICAQAGSYNPYICRIFGKQNDTILNPYFSFNYQQRKVQFGDKNDYFNFLKQTLKIKKHMLFYSLFNKNQKIKTRNSVKQIFLINKSYWGIEKKFKRLQLIKQKYFNYYLKIKSVTTKNKNCVLYLRQKNYNSSEEKIRNGSCLENFKTLFENYQNYSFFCVGDYSFKEFSNQPNVFYSTKLNIPDKLFSLIIWYFCSKFILEPGGPLCFPILFGKPFLLLNYPWFDVPVPGALINYKDIINIKCHRQINMPDWRGGAQYQERLEKAGILLKPNDSSIINDSFKEYLKIKTSKIGQKCYVSHAWKIRYSNLNIMTNHSKFFYKHQAVL